MISCEKLLLFTVLVAAAILPMTVGADTFETLAEIPGLDALNTSTGDFTSFINTIYRMSIGIGSALAVIMIIFAGIQYSMSAVAGEKAKLKDKITMALGGLGLLLGAFVFLNFVNPELTDLDIDNNLTTTETDDNPGIIVPGEIADDIDAEDDPVDPNQPGPQ